MSSHATRAQNGLCRRIWQSLRACKLHVPCAMHMGCTRPAGRLASGKPPPMARVRVLPSQSCDQIEVTAPNGFRSQLVADAPGASCISTDPRGTGTSVGDRGSAVEARSHVARLFKVSHRCADRSWAGPRLVQLAARQLTAVAPPLQGPVASARSCVPLRVRAITTGISHLRSRSFLGPPGTYASVGCTRLRRRIRGALLLFACPCWPTLIRRPEVPCASEFKGVESTVHIKPRPNRRHCAVCPSV